MDALGSEKRCRHGRARLTRKTKQRGGAPGGGGVSVRKEQEGKSADKVGEEFEGERENKGLPSGTKQKVGRGAMDRIRSALQ